MSNDRRQSPRIKILGRLHGQAVSLDVRVTVIEVSLGGLSMETPFPFPIGAVHDFSLTLGDESAVELRGKVVYCRKALGDEGALTYVTGVQFVEDDPPDTPGVGDLLDRITRDDGQDDK